MKFIYMVLIAILFAGCASRPKFNINASIPSYIEVDGVVVCEAVPCTITPPHYVSPFGDCHSGGSLRSVIVAFPKDKSKGFVQQKTINASCNDDKAVFFDMEVTGGIQTIPIKP
ncbi:MAG: hypothetical protein J0665_01075 [Deltaproteobacteria bacterium]|nr:hypothetical protein [Deltaproteobacteria bacterium]